ncbi:MAG: M23 family metallopeptidase [Gallionellaceae bacterium]|nr:M23 family metallopeptidase [Gallionellaceae bacterium]
MKLRWFVALSSLPLLGVLTAFGVMPQTSLTSVAEKTVVQAVELPHAMTINGNTTTLWHSEQVQRGDTVVEILRRLEVTDAAASAWLRNNTEAESFRRLSVGKTVQAETDVDGNLLSLRYLDNDRKQTVIGKAGENFTVSILPPVLEQRLSMRTGVIDTTLFDATDAAGLPDAAASQLAEIFGAHIDFHRDLQKGDRFAVTYETTYSNGEPVGVGRIQAAEFTNQGRVYRAVYFQTSEARGDYYTPEGKSLQKSFLRSPVEFSRISSGFSNARFHPVLQKWRAHKGVDYAAPIGTKVKVTGDGVVSFVGTQNGYGKVIIVDHPGQYSTVYGHLSRYADNLRKGQRVAQGDVIGYVGMTGWTTGSHLHYEFRINGQQRDPQRVALPDAKPIPASQMAAFQASIRNQLERLGLLSETRLARLD